MKKNVTKVVEIDSEIDDFTNKRIEQSGKQLEGEQISAILQAIKESSGVTDLIEFTPTVTTSTLDDFIRQSFSLELVKKIQFGVINIASDNSENKVATSIEQKAAKEQYSKAAGEHWISYIQIPNIFDVYGNVLGVRAIILNSAGNNYASATNVLKDKIEEIASQYNIQITLPIRHLDYQVLDFSTVGDWNTCGIWVCHFFEQTIEKIAKASNPAEISFNELIVHIDIATKRIEYTEWLKAIDISTDSIPRVSYSSVIENKADQYAFGILDISDIEELTLPSKPSLVIASRDEKALIDAIKQNAHPPILEMEEQRAKHQRFNKLISFFTQLGELYINKANAPDLSSQDKIAYYIDAGRFLNYAISISKEKRIAADAALQKIEYINIELTAITGKIATTIKSASKNAQIDKDELIALRDFAEIEVEQIETLPDADKIIRTRVLFEAVAQRMQDFLARLYQESEIILGSPPCSYSVIGLGSMALKTMTPYSDLEFAILTENSHYKENPETKDYFRTLTQLVHFRVINLGETVIPASQMNDYATDHLIKMAVSFDLGGKTPLGRDDKSYELIQTIDEMLKYCTQADKSGVVDKYLSYILKISLHVHGNQELTDRYQESIKSYMNEIGDSGTKNYQQHALEMLKEGVIETNTYKQARLIEGDLSKFNVDKNIRLNEGKLFDAKQEVYRLPDRFMHGFGMYYGIVTNVWEIVDKLVEGRIINVAAQHNILFAIGYSTLLRLRTYQYYEAQNDDISTSIEDKSEWRYSFKEDEVKEGGNLFQFYYTMLTLHEQLAQICEITPNQISIQSIAENNIYDDSKLKTGLIFFRLSKYNEAKLCFEAALSEITKIGVDHLKIADIYTLLAITLTYLGEHRTAVELKLKVVKILGDHALETDSALVNIGNSYRELGEYSEALQYQLQAFELRKKHMPQDHLDLANSLSNIGLSYRDLGDYDRALEFQLKALQQAQLIFSINSQEMAMYYNNIALVYKDLGDMQNALSYQLQVLENVQRTLPTNHPDIAMALSNLGLSYIEVGKYNAALDCMQQALELNKKILPTNHPDIAMSYSNLAICYNRLGNPQKSLQLDLYALELINQNSLGRSDIFISIILNNLSIDYQLLGNFNKALQHNLEALALLQKWLPENHPYIAITLNNVGNRYRDIGNYNEALEHVTQALEIRTKILKAGHHDIAISLDSLGAILLHVDQCDQALENLSQSLELKHKILPLNQLSIATSLENIGAVYKKLQKYDLALQQHLQALEIRQQYLANDHLDVAQSLNNIGASYIDLADFQNAQQYLEQALEIWKKHLPIDHPNIAVTLCDLSNCNEKLSNYVEMLKNGFEAAAIVVKSNSQYTDAVLSNFHACLEVYFESYGVRFAEESIIELQQTIFKEPAIQEFEKLIEFLHQHGSMVYHNLGCQYHVQAVINKQINNEEEFKDSIEEAISSFEISLALNSNSANHAEYANFLYQNSYYDDAMIHSQKSIDLKDDEKGLMYDNEQRETVTIALQKEIDFHDVFKVKAYILSYYLIVKMHMELSNNEEASKYTNALVSEVDKFGNNAMLFSLLGYVFKDLKKFQEASEYFSKAAMAYISTDKNNEYTLAIENKAICLSMHMTSEITTEQQNHLAHNSKNIDIDANEVVQSLITKEEAMLIEKPEEIVLEQARSIQIEDAQREKNRLEIEKQEIEVNIGKTISRNAKILSEQENRLREQLSKLVLEEGTSLFGGEAQIQIHKQRQEIAELFLELSKLYLEEITKEIEQVKNEEIAAIVFNSQEEKSIITKERATKLNEAAIFVNYAINIGEKHNFGEIIIEAQSYFGRIQDKLYEALETQSSQHMYDFIVRDKDLLTTLRSYCSKMLEEIDAGYRDRRGKTDDAVAIMTAEEYEIGAIKMLYEHVDHEVKTLLARTVTECEKVLGTPPCKYAVIGLGSMALKQFTPYSDLEFAILIEDEIDKIEAIGAGSIEDGGSKENVEKALEFNTLHKQYFRNLCQLIHFRIINLGETVIPYSKFDLPLDLYARRGISFDLGGKTPLGRKDKPQYELIQTPYRMAKYLDHKEWIVDKFLPFILESVVHIAGDTAITADYQIKTRTYFYAIAPEIGIPNYQIKSYKKLKEGLDESSGKYVKGDIDAFEPKLTEDSDEGRLFDIKQEIYRLPDRIMYDFATYFGIIPESVWDAIEQLDTHKALVIGENSKAAKHHLSMMTTYSLTLRLRIYSYYGEQNDAMTVLKLEEKETKRNSLITQIFKLAPNELEEDGKLYQYYYTAIPFQRGIRRLFEDKTLQNWLNAEDYYKDDAKTKAMVHKRLLKYAEAEERLKQALEENNNDLEVIWLLGKILSNTGQYAQALKHYQQLLKKEKEIHGEEANPDVALVLNNIAGVNQDQGKYDDALEYYEESLEMFREIYGDEDHSAIAATLNNMATLYQSRGKYEEALSHYQESLDMKKKVYGNKPHSSVAATINNIGEIYKTLSQLEKALGYYHTSLKMCREFCGEGAHPDVAGTINNIARLYQDQGKYEEALRGYQESLAMYKKIYGEEIHPSLAHITNNIAVVYQAQSKYKESLSYYQASLEMSKEIYGEDAHIDVADTINNMAVIYHDQGEYEEALRCYRELLVMQEKVYGENHPDMADTLNNMAVVYKSLGEYEEALNDYQKSLMIYRKIYGEGDHSSVAAAISNVAGVYLAQGMYEEALKYYQESLEIYKKVHGKEVHPSVADITNNIGEVYRAQSKYEEALHCYQESLAMRKKIYKGEIHSSIADTLDNIAGVYQAQGQYYEALSYYQESLDMQKELYKEAHPSLAGTISNMAGLYNTRGEKGDLIKALKLSCKSIAIIGKYEQHQYSESIINAFSIIFENLMKKNKLEFNKEVLQNFLDLVSENELDITDYHLQLKLSQSVYSSGNHEEALIYQKLAQYFIEQSEEQVLPEDMVLILHNLGCMYHVASMQAKASHNEKLANQYYQEAESSFRQALAYSVDNISVGLHTEYGSFLILSGRLAEAIEHIVKSILKENDSSKLTYSLVDRLTVTKVLQDKIDADGESISLTAQEYAYYLLLHHYDQFQQVAELEVRAKYLTDFRELIENTNSPIGCYLLGNIYQELGCSIESELFLSRSTEVPQQNGEEEIVRDVIVIDSQNNNDISIGQGDAVSIISKEIIEIRHMIPFYNNHLLNDHKFQTISQAVYQYGGIEAVNQIFSLGLNKEIYTQLMRDIELDGKMVAFIKWLPLTDRPVPDSSTKNAVLFADNVKNNFVSQSESSSKTLPLLLNEETKGSFRDNQFSLESRTIASFAIKELIEAAPMLKYFFKEILGIQYLLPNALQGIELPDITKHNYFWVGTHYVVCNIGVLTLRVNDLSMGTKLVMPLISSAVYGIKLEIYDTLAQQNQLTFQNTEIKPIDISAEFVERCSFNIAMHSMLALANSGVNKIMFGTPITVVAYDMVIGAAIGGMQYNTYSLASDLDNIQTKSFASAILPYIADATIFYGAVQNTQFDLTTQMGKMVAIKQAIVVISSVVMVDQTTKLLMTAAESDHAKTSINAVKDYISEWSHNLLGDIYGYFIGNE